MKSVIYICVLIFCFSCKSAITAQENKGEDSTMSKNKPTYSEMDIDIDTNPNSIKLIGEVIDIEDKSKLCSRDYENVIVIKVQKIISSGSGIVNVLNQDKSFKAIFSKKLLFNNTSLNSSIKKSDLVQVTVIEKLCKDSTTTIYFVSNYTVQ